MKKVLFLSLFFISINLHALRVISLMPSYTEIIFYLKAEKDLVGVNSFSNWPAEVSRITKVGDYYKPDIEKIYALKPDIIFTGNWETLNFGEKIGKKIKIVYIPNEKKIDDIEKTIEIIAQNLNRKKEGKILIEKFRKEISSLKSDNKKSEKVFIELDSGFWTCGKNSFINDVIEISGGKNIFSDVEKDYFKVSWESVLNKNPDIIISLNTPAEYFYKLALSDKISAIKNRKVYKLTEEERDIISRPSPRITLIIKKLKTIFYEVK